MIKTLRRTTMYNIHKNNTMTIYVNIFRWIFNYLSAQVIGEKTNVYQ